MSPYWQTLALFLLTPAYTAASVFNCDGEKDNGHTFRALPLKGPKQVHHLEDTGPSIRNTTYTIDICDPLKRDNEIEAKMQCHQGTRICAQSYIYHNNDTAEPEEVRSIAGQYTDTNRHMDAKVEWMGSDDAEKKGFKVTMNGGRYPWDGSNGQPQRAVIEFICDENLTGLEGFDTETVKRDDENEEPPELPDLDKGKSLQFVSYKQGEDVDTLRLTWRTKYACDNAPRDDPPASKTHGWGAFTWIVVVLFLLAAAYIIFGSWLNYNRYGARGWDLIPHGDAIRDLPYTIKDLASNLMGRIRGEGSRGGYSAV